MNRLTKKIDNCGSTERKSGSGRPWSLRTADNVSMIQDMQSSWCSLQPYKPPQNAKTLNTATSLKYCLLSAFHVTFVVADGPLTSIN